MTLQTRKLTYEDYLNGPEIKARYDIVDGVMTMAPAPTLEHQRLLRQLFKLLDSFVTEHGLGEVLFAPLDVVIQREPLRTRQPDLLFVSTDRAGIMEDYIQGPPNLVAEILSPSNTRHDMDDKLFDYGRLGVDECWLVSPEARTVEVLRLVQQSMKRTSIHGLGDQVQSNVISGLTLAVEDLFR
ncbi:MAG: Uma2 family endonuclease [Chloroflexi bacterium]|nr:Uma2 family endonuclease [Chloroflexota bacterium]